MATLDDEIAAYNTIKNDLEEKHRGEWVVVCNRKLVGIYGSFQQAANLALKTLGARPYLIRRIGASPVPLPVSVLYSSPDGAN